VKKSQVSLKKKSSSEKKLDNGRSNSLPLSHLPRERTRRYWGVVVSPMARLVSAERLFARRAVGCGLRPFSLKPKHRSKSTESPPRK
jgi:hypothetical protein